MFLLLFLGLFDAHALEVIKFESNRKIELKIVRADPESFETYSLLNHNGREMILVCANNRVYDNNKKAFIEYKNYYQEVVAQFTLESNEVCLDMGKYIENVHSAISAEKPFLISLNTKDLKVTKVVYPNIDPFADEGLERDLLPRKLVPITLPKVKKSGHF